MRSQGLATARIPPVEEEEATAAAATAVAATAVAATAAAVTAAAVTAVVDVGMAVVAALLVLVRVSGVAVAAAAAATVAAAAEEEEAVSSVASRDTGRASAQPAEAMAAAGHAEVGSGGLRWAQEGSGGLRWAQVGSGGLRRGASATVWEDARIDSLYRRAAPTIRTKRQRRWARGVGPVRPYECRGTV